LIENRGSEKAAVFLCFNISVTQKVRITYLRMLENIILILFVVIGFSDLFRVNKITGKINYPK